MVWNFQPFHKNRLSSTDLASYLPVLLHGLERGLLVEVDHLVLLDARVVVVSAQIRSAHVVPQKVVVVVRIDGNPLRQRVNVG